MQRSARAHFFTDRRRGDDDAMRNSRCERSLEESLYAKEKPWIPRARRNEIAVPLPWSRFIASSGLTRSGVDRAAAAGAATAVATSRWCQDERNRASASALSKRTKERDQTSFLPYRMSFRRTKDDVMTILSLIPRFKGK